VALTIEDGVRAKTGCLINNTQSDDTPYFLTCNHSTEGDALGDSTLSWNFMFMYETENCSNPQEEPQWKELGSGAILLANISINDGSDFALLRLNKDPKEVLSNDSIYYAGWDRNDEQDSGGVAIHHPQGDVKKIATVKGNISTYINNTDLYFLYMDSTSNGYSHPEDGSSGSPLFNSHSKVIGQLYGSSDFGCSYPAQDYAYYGKLYSSWNGSQKERRLKDWLDPLGINPTALEGRYAGSPKVNPCKFTNDTAKIENTTITQNTIFRTRCSYTIRNTTIDNNASVIVSHQWETVIENDFEIKSGCSFELYAQ
jgi:hypothetical protein